MYRLRKEEFADDVMGAGWSILAYHLKSVNEDSHSLFPRDFLRKEGGGERGGRALCNGRGKARGESGDDSFYMVFHNTFNYVRRYVCM